MFEAIENLEDVIVEKNYDLSRFSTMGLKSTGILITVTSLGGLKNLLPKLDDYQLLGWGANQLLPETSKTPYIKLKFPFERESLKGTEDIYSLPASVSLSSLTSHAAKFGVKGWEVFTGIPASLGGAIFMNAGTNLGEIGEIVQTVRVVKKDGSLKEIKINEQSFSYRENHFVEKGDVIYEADLVHFGKSPEISEKIKKYLKLRNHSQPLKEKTCGCIFQNAQKEELTCRAGLSIDILGLKGLRVGDMKLSHKHANFMENTDKASQKEVLSMIDIVKDELLLNFGVHFETEAKLGKK